MKVEIAPPNGPVCEGTPAELAEFFRYLGSSVSQFVPPPTPVPEPMPTPEVAPPTVVVSSPRPVRRAKARPKKQIRPRVRLPQTRSALKEAAKPETPTPLEERHRAHRIGGKLSVTTLNEAFEVYARGMPVREWCEKTKVPNGVLVSTIVTQMVKQLGGERHRGVPTPDPKIVAKWNALSTSQRSTLVENALAGRGKEKPIGPSTADPAEA